MGYSFFVQVKKRQYLNVAKSGGRFDCSFFKKEGGAIEHSVEKQPDTTQPLTLMRQRNIAPGRTRLRGFRGRSQPPPISYYFQNFLFSLWGDREIREFNEF